MDQLLSVFGEENLMDMSEGGPTRSDGAAREGFVNIRLNCSRNFQ
jgi:hypothetical protein